MRNYWRWGVVGGGLVIWFLGLYVSVQDVELTEIFVSPGKAVDVDAVEERGDLNFHAAVVNRVAAGERYYDALRIELHARDYPTSSVFNWRAPLPLWLWGKIPSQMIARGLLAILGITFVAFSARLQLEQSGRLGALIGGIPLVGTVMLSLLPKLWLDHLLWVTLLFGCGVCASAYKRPSMFVLCGACAIFFRELGIGFCLVALVLAWSDGRRRESAAWLLTLLAWGVYFAWHVHLVKMQPTESGAVDLDTSSWWNPKSPWFWVRCARVNGLLTLLPGWCSYVYLTAALLGLLAIPNSIGRFMRLSVFGYLAAFLVVGKNVNDYWGMLLVAPLAFSVGWLPTSVRRIGRWLGFGVNSLEKTELADRKSDGARLPSER